MSGETIWEERRRKEGGALYEEKQRMERRDQNFKDSTDRINAPDYEVPRTGE